MSYRDKRIKDMNRERITSSDDPFENLIDQTQNWIEDYELKDPKALFNWNADKASEFSKVPISTLIRDDYFLGFGDKVYDEVERDIIDLFAERKKRPINLAIFQEGIGSGKTAKASILSWLSWFELSTQNVDPQEYYGLAPRSVIAMMMFSRSEKQSREVTLTEVWNRFQSPFNKDYFPPVERFKREIRIPTNNTCIFAGTSSALSALGYNLYGATIDEAAFLEQTDESKKSPDMRYDACETMYYAIYNRMLSRFMRDGIIPGFINMISSPQFPNDFMTKMIDKAVLYLQLAKESNIFWRRRATWEAKGVKTFPEFDGGYNKNGEWVERDNFFIDTEETDIVNNPDLVRFLKSIDPKKFPLNISSEDLAEISRYYREVA